MMKETVIFSLSSSKALTQEICSFLNLPVGDISVHHFADGEILVELEQTVRGRDVYIIQSTYAPVNENVMEILIACDCLRRASAHSINLVIPYFGYARQDRKAKARQPITARLVADLYQTAGASRVITIDLHAAQIQGFFNVPIDDLTAIPMMGQYFKTKHLEDVVVVSPDHGGTTRARKLAEILDAPLAIVDKRRPKPNVCEAMNVIGDVKDKNAILVDDIIDTAGSLVAAAKIVKESGAKNVYFAATHGVLSGPAMERIRDSVLSELLITNTIPLSEEKKAVTDKVKVLSVGYMIAKTIEAIQSHTPVSDVYNYFSRED